MDKIRDFVSGEWVNATPEEVASVQPYAKKLVEDYGYPLDQIQTHPQFRVKVRPSGGASYPVDIAVFSSSRKVAEKLHIIVECKADGGKVTGKALSQLKNYFELSAAEFCVLHSPDKTYHYQKVGEGKRNVAKEIPDIPRHGEKFEEIGRFRYKDLKPPRELAIEFNLIRNLIAASATGNLSAEGVARDIINLLFCKIVDEKKHEDTDEMLLFRRSPGDSADAVMKRINHLFEQVKWETYFHNVVQEGEQIALDSKTVADIVARLQKYRLLNSDKDVIGNAFEVFIGPALAGEEGQFFTPRKVVETMVNMVGINRNMKIVDPACGSGGFLTVCLDKVSESIENQTQWSERKKGTEKTKFAHENLFGIDKDRFLSKVARAYMALLGDGRTHIFCDNSLLPAAEWQVETQAAVAFDKFDVLLTNPPFGSKLPVEPAIIARYELGRRWKTISDERGVRYEMKDETQDKSPPQILFIERCLELVKPGGKMGIVLPEGLFGNPSHFYIMNWIIERADIEAVVSLPTSAFKLSGKQGTSTRTQFLILTKRAQSDKLQAKPIFMAIAQKIGHDSRGNVIDTNELEDIITKWVEFQSSGRLSSVDRLGFLVGIDAIQQNKSLVCRRYDPGITGAVNSYISKEQNIRSIGELEEAGLLKRVSTGPHIKKDDYLLDDDDDEGMPFIRTSDIANMEIVSSTAKRVPADNKCVCKEGDVLFVKDGDKLVGETALVTAQDLPFALQNHFYCFRSLDHDRLNPYLLLALLNTKFCKKQIRSLIVVQSTLGNIGSVYKDIMLPFPKNPGEYIEAAKTAVMKRREILDEFNQFLNG